MITYHSETEFTYNLESISSKGIETIIQLENKKLQEIGVIFCNDEYLLKMNQEHLNHDYYTDIITFDYSENNLISGDLFISIDRVKENATINDVAFNNELLRVIYHGVLHLCGYKDKTTEDQTLMTEKEDYYLHLHS